ncbi:MAG: hypothetical protein U5N53_28430 [Mycobacterium sp.]|nr:hypothetical protein [Mycobacterium sp.]
MIDVTIKPDNELQSLAKAGALLAAAYDAATGGARCGVGDERFEDLGLGCTISVASADQPAAPAPVDSFAWDPTSVSIAVLAVAAYIVAGLYVSRWWWRNDGEAAFTAEAQILAFGVWAMWPLYPVAGLDVCRSPKLLHEEWRTMSDLVPPEDIERIVGAGRHATDHLGRAVSSEQTVYVLHSHQCVDSGIDLRQCVFSQALDRGIDLRDWRGSEDRAVQLRIRRGALIPRGIRS